MERDDAPSGRSGTRHGVWAAWAWLARLGCVERSPPSSPCEALGSILRGVWCDPNDNPSQSYTKFVGARRATRTATRHVVVHDGGKDATELHGERWGRGWPKVRDASKRESGLEESVPARGERTQPHRNRIALSRSRVGKSTSWRRDGTYPVKAVKATDK
jgi:hypothetical protein